MSKKVFSQHDGESVKAWALRIETIATDDNLCSMPNDFYIGDIVGECAECGAPVNKDGECEIGCEYGYSGCDKCHIHFCDLGC